MIPDFARAKISVEREFDSPNGSRDESKGEIKERQKKVKMNERKKERKNERKKGKKTERRHKKARKENQ